MSSDSASASTTDTAPLSATLARWKRFFTALIGLLLIESAVAAVVRIQVLRGALGRGEGFALFEILAIGGLVILGPLLYAVVRLRSLQHEIATLVHAEQQALRETRTLLDTTTEGIFRIDESGLCTMANRAAGEFLGYRPEQLIGRHMHDLIHHTRPDGSSYAVEDCPIYKAMRDGKATQVDDEVFWRSDGSSFSAAYSSNPIMDGESVNGAVVSFKNIDERKRMEQALNDSYQRTLSFMEHLPLGVFVVDDSGRPIYSNGAAQELLGVAADTSVESAELSTAYQVYVAGTNRLYDPARLPVARALAGETVDVDDIEIHRPDGSVVPLQVWAGPIRDEHGAIRYGAAVFSDIRARKEAEAALRESERSVREASKLAERERKKAEEASRAKSEFLSRMSHELRTPLNGIIGFSQLLEMEKLRPDHRDNVKQIRKAGEHLLDLINEVLDLARIEAGRLSMSLEPIDVSGLVNECVAMVGPLASEREISIRSNGHTESQGGHALGDRQRLKQIILNLLSNAIKYNRPRGSVEVDWQRAGDDKVVISVSDTGPGIPPQKLERLFTAFDRLDVVDADVEGAGLGLVLSSNLAKAMGGNLEATSEVGIGSCFTLRVPAAEPIEAQVEVWAEEVADVVREETVTEPHLGTTGTLLYVEDNPANVKLVERILKHRPWFELLTASDGESGLAMVRDLHPQLVLLDVNLPGINGDMVLRTLKQDPSTADIPVVFLSADATEQQVRRLLEAGAADYVTKPLDVNHFLATIDRHLGRKNEVADAPED